MLQREDLLSDHGRLLLLRFSLSRFSTTKTISIGLEITVVDLRSGDRAAVIVKYFILDILDFFLVEKKL